MIKVVLTETSQLHVIQSDWKKSAVIFSSNSNWSFDALDLESQSLKLPRQALIKT